MLEDDILNYIDYLQDKEYLAEIVTSTAAAELCSVINSLLQSSNVETVSLTCLFITDLRLIGKHYPECKGFIEEHLMTTVVKTLEQLAFSENHWICRRTINTLGKICSYSSLATLNQAFATLRDTNPLVLPSLMREMCWLGAENFWELLDSMMSSPVYATRWAVINVLPEFGYENTREKDELFQHKHRILEQLRQDASLYVRAEAEFEYQLLKFRSESHELAQPDRRKKEEALERELQPALCFIDVEGGFERYLSDKASAQYSIGELEALIAEMAQANRIP